MRLFFLLPTLFVLASSVQAQEARSLDSLRAIYSSTTSADTTRILALCEIAKQFYRNKPDTAIALATQAAEQSQKIGFDKGRARAYNIIGLGHWIKTNHAEALTFYQKSLPYFETSGDREGYGLSLNNIGLIYYYQSDYPLALEYFQKALAMHEESGYTEGVALALNNIGLSHEARGDATEALEYYRRALKIYEQADIKIGVGQALTNIGYIYFAKKDYPSALAFQQRAAKIQEEVHDRSTLISTLLCISEIYHQQKQYELGVRTAQQALNLARQLKSTFDEKEAVKFLYTTYKAQQNFAKAIDYLEKFKALNDSIFSIENNKAIASIESRMVLERKQKKIEVLEQQSILQRRINYVIASALVCMALLVIYIFRHRRKLQLAYDKLEAANNKLQEVKEEVETQADLLHKSNQTKDKIFSIVSHDLRSPLAALKSLIGLLEKDSVTLEEFKQFVPDLSRRVTHASDIVEELLHWSQSQMDVLELHPIQFSVHDLLSAKAQRFKSVANDKGVQLSLNGVDKTTTAFADVDMIKAVLRNLITNAIKFSNAGDSIVMSATIDNAFVKISVKDTGIGIHPDDLAKIFAEHGFTTYGTANEKGTGLGLMLCRDFVEKNGGRIQVESRVGEGTSFSFTIPAHA